MKNNRQLFAIGLLLLFMLPQAANAERYGTYRNSYADSYIGLGMRAGMGELQLFGLDDVTTKPGFSYGFDLCYQGGFGRRFGFLLGVSFAKLSSGLSVEGFESSYTDSEKLQQGGYEWEGTAHCVGTTKLVEETYNTTFFEIPVLFTYTMDAVFFDLGLKFSLPMKSTASYHCGETHVVIDGFLDLGQDFSDEPKFKEDIAEFDGEYVVFGNGGISQALTVYATAELGYQLQFAGNSSLQFAAYIDYGVGGVVISNPKSDNLLSLGSGKVEYVGMVKDGHVTGLNFVKCGIKAQYNIGLGKTAKSGKAIRIL